MASSYSPNDAISLVQAFGHGIPLTTVQAHLCDIINNMIWTYYPWGWSIASLTPTNLNQQEQAAGVAPTGGADFTGNQQDYVITGAWFSYPISLQAGGTPNNNYGGGWPIALASASTPGLTEAGNVVTVTLNYEHNLPTGATLAGQTGTITGATVAGYNDTLTITSVPSTTSIVGTIATAGLADSGGSGSPGILRPLNMRISRVDTDPPEYRELKLLNNLGVELTMTTGIDGMQAIGWNPSRNFFRMALSPQVSTGQILQISGTYQTLPTKITNFNLASNFLFPDHYFNIFVDGLKWKIYQLSDDPRAGTITISKNGTQVKTGQFGIFTSQLEAMASTEGLSDGDQFSFPDNPLGSGQMYGYGIFGL